MSEKETTRVTITLPTELYETCKELAKNNDRTIGAQIANMLKKYLEQNKDTSV